MVKSSYFESFIEKANKKYNNFFDYSKFNYVNAKTKSIIICPKHGEFEQNPDKHLNGKYGCEKCANEGRKITSKGIIRYKKQPDSKEMFLEKAYKKYGDKFEYDLSNYTGITGNIIRIKCREHGWFEKLPRNFLVCGFGCSECGFNNRTKAKTKSYDNFLKKAIEIHGDKYIYLEENKNTYINRKSKVKIYCKKHKEIFTKKAQKHLTGQGCFKCKIEELVSSGVLAGGYSEDFFKRNEHRKSEKAYLYYLSIDNGEYYKIGISTQVKRRMDSLRSEIKRCGYNELRVVYTLETTLFSAYNIEQEILEEFKRYRVHLEFSTEIFSKDISDKPLFRQKFNL